MEKEYIIAGILIAVLITGGAYFFTARADSGENEPVDIDALLSEYPELEGDPGKVTVYFFWGDGCPHCAEEKPFLEDLKQEYPEDLEVKMFEVYHSQKNVELFRAVAKAYGTEAGGVPATFIGENNWVGFRESTTGEEIESYIEKCMDEGCESPLGGGE